MVLVVCKTSEGTFWYVVDPAARTKKLLFDRDELASQLTEIVKDPFEARHLPITNLKAEEDGRTFTFEVIYSAQPQANKYKQLCSFRGSKYRRSCGVRFPVFESAFQGIYKGSH